MIPPGLAVTHLVFLLSAVCGVPAGQDRVEAQLPDPWGQAGALLAEDRFEEALALLESRVLDDPRDPRLLDLLGQAAWRAGQIERAAEVYALALHTNPRDARALAGLAHWFLVHGDLEPTESYARLAVESAPGESEGWFALAQARARQGDLAEAEKALVRAVWLLGGSLSASRTARRALEALESVRSLATSRLQVEGATRLGRVPFRLEQGCPVVEVTVEGTDGPLQVPVLVDTGGSLRMGLDVSLIDAVRFEPQGRLPVHSVSGAEEGTAGELLRLDYGSWSFQRVPVVFYSLQGSQTSPPPYLGNLGPVLARDRVLILHWKRRRVSVLDPLPDGQAYPADPEAGALRLPFLRVGDGKVVLSLRSGGREVLALVDTGAARSRCSQRFQERPSGHSIALGDWVVSVPQLEPLAALDQEISPSLGLEISLLLGMDFLGMCQYVVLDYATQHVTLETREGVDR